MPIISNNDPNYRDGDFVTTYPHAVVVCTDLPSSTFSDDADKYWIIANLSVAIGTVLDMHERSEAEALMEKLQKHGMLILTLADCSFSDVLSGSQKIDKVAEGIVRSATSSSADESDITQFRILHICMPDIFEKTSVVQYCCFFEDTSSETSESEKNVSPPETAQKERKEKTALPHFLHLVSRSEVERLDVKRVHEASVEACNDYINTRVLKPITIRIDGFDSDTRALFDIPEVRAWARALRDSVPIILTVVDTETLKWLIPCLAEIESVATGESTTGWRFKQGKSNRFIETEFGNRHNLFQRICPSQEEFDKLCDEHFARFLPAIGRSIEEGDAALAAIEEKQADKSSRGDSKQFLEDEDNQATRNESKQDSTGDDNESYSDKKKTEKPSCFLATAAYTKDAEELKVLREYRDTRLLTSAWGRQAVRVYYAVSPALSRWVSKSHRRRRITRWLLYPFVQACRNAVATTSRSAR